eukprot:1916755-Rhodomonas_salina.1
MFSCGPLRCESLLRSAGARGLTPCIVVCSCAVAQPLPLAVLPRQRRQPEGRGGGATQGVEDGGRIQEGRRPFSYASRADFTLP